MADAVTYTPAARRDLNALDRRATARIREAVNDHAGGRDVNGGHVDALARGAGHRLAVGPYRVLYSRERGERGGIVVHTVVRVPETFDGG